MDASDYRMDARDSLSGNWKNAVLTWFVATLLGGAVISLPTIQIDIKDNTLSLLSPEQQHFLTTVLFVLGIYAVIQLFLGAPIRIGYSQYLMDLHNCQSADLKTIFSYFFIYRTSLVLSLLLATKVLLRTLLFVIPGIVASYSYSMSSFILAENPDMTASEALSASKQIMEGNKWALFCLDVSFIGWNLLNIVTLGLAGFYVGPYHSQARAAFYSDLEISEIY